MKLSSNCRAGRKNCRVLQMSQPFSGGGYEFRSCDGRTAIAAIGCWAIHRKPA